MKIQNKLFRIATFTNFTRKYFREFPNQRVPREKKSRKSWKFLPAKVIKYRKDTLSKIYWTTVSPFPSVNLRGRRKKFKSMEHFSITQISRNSCFDVLYNSRCSSCLFNQAVSASILFYILNTSPTDLTLACLEWNRLKVDIILKYMRASFFSQDYELR